MITLAYIAPNGTMFHMSYPDAGTTLTICRAIAAMPGMQPLGINFPDYATLRDYVDRSARVEPFDRAAIVYSHDFADDGPPYGYTCYGVQAYWWDMLTTYGCIWPDECPVPQCLRSRATITEGR